MWACGSEEQTLIAIDGRKAEIELGRHFVCVGYVGTTAARRHAPQVAETENDDGVIKMILKGVSSQSGVGSALTTINYQTC